MVDGNDSTIWYSLLSETQYATEITLLGLRSLCQVPLQEDVLSSADSVRYRLHVGMHSYSAGIERLGKIAIACRQYLDVGRFPDVRKYSHSITAILKELQSREFPGSWCLFPEFVDRERSLLDDDVLDMVDRFAKGTGRYEYIDSLATGKQASDIYSDWTRLCSRASQSRRVAALIRLHEEIPNALYSGMPDHSHALLYGLLDNAPGPFFERSVALTSTLFEIARFIGCRVSAASRESFYGRRLPTVPLLSEAVDRALLHPWAEFFEFHIVQLSDASAVADALGCLDEAE